ncbi:protease [Arthrobacter phage Ingrid]|nr:protease [Arthrobacter phage Ingrid]QFG10992.1 protease [Arthrobacter phage Loretta]
MTKTADEFLAHYGVKGMKWGVRKDQETGGDDKFRFQGPTNGVRIDSALHETTQKGAAEVASLISNRYGFHINEVLSIGPGHPEYEMGTVGYVQLGSGSANTGSMVISQGDLAPRLQNSVDIGWTKPAVAGKEIHGLLTHESAHAMFHAQVKIVKAGMFGGYKQVGGNIEARDVALGVALREADRDGIKMQNFMPSISGYAHAAGIREEAEAEMFMQYHWHADPPRFVKAWGESLHHEMGLDPTPFKDM